MYDALAKLDSARTESATYTATAVNLKAGTPRRGLTARLRVTGVSGTSPTSDVKVQDSDDGTTYHDLVAFPRITAAGVFHRTFETPRPYVRLVNTIGGTNPVFTVGAVEIGVARP